MATAGSLSGAAAQEAPPGPAAPGTQTANTELELVDQTTWLRPGDRFEADVRVANRPPGAALQVAMHGRLLTRSGFQQSLEGNLGRQLSAGEPEGLTELPPNADGSVTVGMSLDGSVDTEGVYPVELRLLDEAGGVSANLVTHLVVLPPEGVEFPPLATAVTVDISSAPALQPDGEVTMSQTALDRIGERIAALEQAPGVPLTLAPRPETLDGLARIGDDRGGALLGRLAAARGDRPVLARPYTDVDIAAFMAAGLVSELNTQAEGGADVVRSRLGVEPAPGIWLPQSTVGDAAAELRVELGANQAVIDRSAVAEVPGLDPGQLTVAPIRLGGGGPTSMVSDAALANHLRAGNGVLDAQHMVAELAMIWAERPAIQRGVVVHVPPERPVDPATLARALDLVQEGPLLAPVTLDGLFDRFRAASAESGEAPPVATPAPHEIEGNLEGVAPGLRRARARVGGFGDTVRDTKAGQSLQDSLLLATGSDTPNGDRRAYVDRVNVELAELDDIVSAPDEFRITLTSRSSTIPLNLTNHADQPLDVRIDFDSNQLQFPDGERMAVTLEPGPNRLDIRVRTLASGAFPLDIEIVSPDGSIVLDRTTFDIRSTTVSGVGLVLSIGAGLFLAIWWVRHWRRGRRAGRLVPAGEMPSTDAAPGGDAAAVDGRPGPPDGGSPRRLRRGRYQPAHLAGRRSR